VAKWLFAKLRELIEIIPILTHLAQSFPFGLMVCLHPEKISKFVPVLLFTMGDGECGVRTMKYATTYI